MKSFELSEEDFGILLRLCHLYHREAQKCMDAGAYLAGCVMIGATLEAELLVMCHCYFEEIPAELVPKLKTGQPKPLLEWTFFELLQVARGCNWLPAHLGLDDEWDHKKAHIGDYAEVVREVRNLVHPSRYLTDLAKSRMTKGRMEMCFEILEVASEHLQAKLCASLEAILEDEGTGAPDKLF